MSILYREVVGQLIVNFMTNASNMIHAVEL